MSDDTPPLFDLFIVGGGINGTGIARDAAGRGLSVYLCEKGDLAQGTSSASTKLIHGGLRYLEFYEFRLVREALREREILLCSAPHIIWPMEFVLPHSPGLRSIWLVRLGLFLYDHLARRKRLGRSYSVNLWESRFGRPLKKFVKQGFVYSDCWVEDSRLVMLAAYDAALHGAQIHTYTEFVSAEKAEHLWRIVVRHGEGTDKQRDEVIFARSLVNAAGPGLAKVAQRIHGGGGDLLPLRLVKGSHIVVKRLYEGGHAYILQHPDRRMVFVIPFEDEFTLIGTTDQPANEADLDAPKISPGEIDYLLEAVNMYFTKTLTQGDIAHTYAGIRPLFDDGSTDNSRVTRDYMIVAENDCVSVYGGKITTFRRLAEEVVDRILAERHDSHELRPAWTARAVLPGGDIPGSLTDFVLGLLRMYPFLSEDLANRLAGQYGTRVHVFLKDVKKTADLGRDLGGELYTREVDFLMEHEWARCPDDILLRRTRIGLHAAPGLRENLEAYLAQKQ